MADTAGTVAVARSRVAFIVMTRNGVRFLEEEPLGVGHLLLLEHAARGGTAATEVDRIAADVGGDATALREFAVALDERGIGRDEGGGHCLDIESEPTARHQAAAMEDIDADAKLVLPTPFVIGLGSRGFQEHDHDGRLRLRLTAAEVAAMALFRTPLTLSDAIEQHRQEAGSAALDDGAFAALVESLRGIGLLQTFDPKDLSFRHGYNTAAEAYRRENTGRRMVGAAMKRSMAKLDEIERERRERLGTARTKVLPVHSIRTAWRNPPLSLGLILAYAGSYKAGMLKEHYDIRPDWMIDEASVDAYAAEPAIYLFSSYIWSSAGNLALSARVKEKSPASITIHGGPDVPKYEADVAVYLREHPHVDIVARGEGEISIAELLEALIGKMGDGPVDLAALRDVPGFSFREDATIVRTPDRERLADLDLVPSPYLEGIFDAYAEGWRELGDAGGTGTDAWAYQLPVVVLETNRGCPYGCTFCDWGSATMSRIRQYSLERIYSELEWCSKSWVDSVGLADANFGILARDVDITAKVAELKTTQGFPKQFGTNYAKNSVKHLKQIVETLAAADILSYGLLSLQSMDADTLKVINRANIKLDKYEDLAREFQKAQLPLYVDLMVGLPGQTVRSFGNDLQECINREVHAKIFPTQLLVNSPMNSPSYREQFGIVQKPGELVIQSSSFTRDEYDAMMRMRAMFFVAEKFGVLRHVGRYVRSETGMREIDFFELLWEESQRDPERWPVIEFTLHRVPMLMVPPVSWALLMGEVRRFLVEHMDIPDDAALETVLEVQVASLPSRGRQFPGDYELSHDYAAWHASMMDAKHEGHLDDWHTVVRPLREYPPGTFHVDDPRDVCLYEMGRPAENNPWTAWDLNSPVSRPTTQQA